MFSMLELCYTGILVKIDENKLSDNFRFLACIAHVFGGEIMTFVVIFVILLCAGRIDAQTRVVPGGGTR